MLSSVVHQFTFFDKHMKQVFPRARRQRLAECWKSVRGHSVDTNQKLNNILSDGDGITPNDLKKETMLSRCSARRLLRLRGLQLLLISSRCCVGQLLIVCRLKTSGATPSLTATPPVSPASAASDEASCRKVAHMPSFCQVFHSG